MSTWFKKNKYIIIFILFLSLIPLLWFRTETLITGTDVDYPLFPVERLQERLYTWFPGVLGGTDRSNNVASIPFFVLPAFFNALGFEVIATEQINFVFWFALSGFSMYFLLSVLTNKKNDLGILFGILFYMINFYHVFLWVRLQLSVTSVVLFPALLAVLIGVTDKKIRLPAGLLIVSALGLVCGPTGIQPPIIYILILTITLFFLYKVLIHVRGKDITGLPRLFLEVTVISGIYFLSSAYWLLPLLNFINSAGYNSGSHGSEVYAISGLLKWVGSITSFTNVFRLYGDIPWFDSWGNQPYMPEFEKYLTDPVLIAFSFILPVLAYSAVFIKTKLRYTGFFLLITTLSIFLSKGIHDPFGDWYLWLVDNVPAFWIQRAPWQKFALLTIIGYSVLGGMTIGEVLRNMSLKSQPLGNTQRNLIVSTVTVLFVGLWLGYNHLFVLGQMFPEGKGTYGYHQKNKLGFHIEFPPYIFAARDWIQSKKDYFKIMLLPDDRTNVYTWGYGGAGDVTPLIFQKGILNRQYGEGFSPPQSSENLYAIYINNLYNGLTSNSTEILRMLNIQYILQRNDFRYNFYGDIDSPEFIRMQLRKQRDISLEKTFGKWDFYKVSNSYPTVYIPSAIINIGQDIENITYFLNSPHYVPNSSPKAYITSDAIRNSSPSSMDADYYNFAIQSRNIMLVAHNGWVNKDVSVNLNTTPTHMTIASKYFPGTKPVISDSGNGTDDTLIFDSPQDVPYKLMNNATTWSAKDSTLIYINTDDKPLVIRSIKVDNKPVQSIVGAWWRSGWLGGGTREVTFPIVIPPYENAVIQIGHIIDKPINLTLIDTVNNTMTQRSRRISSPTLVFERKNSVEYSVKLSNLTHPIPLILSENYHPQWKAYLKNTPIDDYHRFIANGYANGWIIDPALVCVENKCIRSSNGSYTLELSVVFTAQYIFYWGILISAVTFLSCLITYIFTLKKIRVNNEPT